LHLTQKTHDTSHRLAILALIALLSAAPRPASATMPAASGITPAPVAQAFASGLLDVPVRPPLSTSVAQTQWYIPIIMVGFTDQPLTHTAAEFEHELFDTTGSTPNGSVYDYYQWISGGRLRVTGKVVAVLNMPQPRLYYSYNAFGLDRNATPNNLFGLVHDALAACYTTIDWSPFDQNHDGVVDMLWVLHAGQGGEAAGTQNSFWSITSSLSGGWRFGATFVTNQLLPGTAGQYYQLDRFSSLPEISPIIPTRAAEIGVFCHEFGHALGLPDLYDTSGIPLTLANFGPGNWSLMSTGANGGNGLTPERPAHMGAWCTKFLGWTPTFRPDQDGPVTLGPVEDGNPAMEMWFQGEDHSEHFLVENRQLEGPDASLTGSGLIIYHVDDDAIALRLPGNRINTGTSPGLQVVEADGGYDMWLGLNRGTASDAFPGPIGRSGIGDETLPNLRTFAGARTNLALGNIHAVGNNIQMQVQVNMPGWQPETGVTAPNPALIDATRPTRWAVTDAQHRVFVVRSEIRAGIPQIVLYSRLAYVWQPPEVISSTTAAAFDPGIALLPGGDLAVTWTDSRSGRLQVFYRARIRGAWGQEQSISALSGDSHHSSIGADANGMIEVVFLNEQASSRQVMFKRFSYLSPFGAPAPVTFPGEQPDPPALAVRPNGAAYIVWSDRTASPQQLYFARFTPDSGVSARNPLTPPPAGPQLSVAIAVDGQGNLHTLWQVGGSSVNGLHYQRRRANGTPAPQDTLLGSANGLLQGLSAAVDDSLDIHVAYEDWSGPVTRICYKRWTPSGGWEYGGANVSAPTVFSTQPIVLPHAPGDVTTLYVSTDGESYTLQERRRKFGTTGTTSVPVEPSIRAGFRVGPNPLRAGSALRFSGAADLAADRLEVFDVTGRRVATVPVRAVDGRFEAVLDGDATRGWRGGVYFATLHGSAERTRFVVLR
jgi:immune inhibitor A